MKQASKTIYLFFNSELHCILKTMARNYSYMLPFNASISVSFGVFIEKGCVHVSVCVCAWTGQHPSFTDLKTGKLTKQHRGPRQANSYPMRLPRKKSPKEGTMCDLISSPSRPPFLSFISQFSEQWWLFQRLLASLLPESAQWETQRGRKPQPVVFTVRRLECWNGITAAVWHAPILPPSIDLSTIQSLRRTSLISYSYKSEKDNETANIPELMSIFLKYTSVLVKTLSGTLLKL